MPDKACNGFPPSHDTLKDRSLRESRGGSARFEAAGFNESMSDDYFALHELYTRMIEEQRRYTWEMLAAKE